MDKLLIVSDFQECSQEICGKFSDVFEVQSLVGRDVLHVEPTKHIILDVNFNDNDDFTALRQWLKDCPKDGKVIFTVEKKARHQVVQANALGATHVVERPITRSTILTAFLGDIEALAVDDELATENFAGVAAGISALQNIFVAVTSGSPIDLNKVNSACNTVVANVQEDGIAHWIDNVRQHHSQTYQHCLLVTGIVVAFGQHLGFSQNDRQKLALSGLLHDIGKAGIPIEILEKPGPLTKEEFAKIKEHPVLGIEALRGIKIDTQVIDAVVQHHEYLDGSGYPHGLDSARICDLVRLTTISDVFGALLERRAYKAPLSGEAAYQILENMGAKLDKDLVHAFRPFSRAQIT